MNITRHQLIRFKNFLPVIIHQNKESSAFFDFFSNPEPIGFLNNLIGKF